MSYTQSPHLTQEEIEVLLGEARVARFCSLNADGTIHAVPVWYSYLQNKIVVATPVASRKAKNVKRNRNVTLLIDESETRGVWPRGVVVYGEADVETNDLKLEEFTRLCEKYVSGGKARDYAKGLLGLSRWVKISVTTKHMASFDYMKDQAYKAATGE